MQKESRYRHKELKDLPLNLITLIMLIIPTLETFKTRLDRALSNLI